MVTNMADLLKRLEWTRLASRERTLVLVTAAVVAFVAFYMVLLPARGRLQQARERAAILTGEVGQMEVVASELRSKADRIRKSRQSGEVAEEFRRKASDIMPGGSRLSSFLEELTRLARMRQVEFVSIRPEGIEDKEAYLQLRMGIDVKSRFRQLGEYLVMLEDLPRAMMVEEIKIESGIETSPYVMAHLKAVTFMAKE